MFNKVQDKEYTSLFNIANNQATSPIKAFPKKEGCRWQFVESSNHRVNAAEMAIQAIKNYFISALSSTDMYWPLQLWDQLSN